MTKACSCGAVYDLATWELLHLVGVKPDPPVLLEFRDCGICKNTLVMWRDEDGDYMDTHPDDTPIDCPWPSWP